DGHAADIEVGRLRIWSKVRAGRVKEVRVRVVVLKHNPIDRQAGPVHHGSRLRVSFFRVGQRCKGERISVHTSELDIESRTSLGCVGIVKACSARGIKTPGKRSVGGVPLSIGEIFESAHPEPLNPIGTAIAYVIRTADETDGITLVE